MSFLLPVLDEVPETVARTVVAAQAAATARGLLHEIQLWDGGSRPDACVHYRDIVLNQPGASLHRSFPPLRPNKDIAVINGVAAARFEYLAIVDTDIVNLDPEHMLALLDPLLDGAEFVVPDLDRAGGRWNRLLALPALRIFFPDVAARLPYPCPGLCSARTDLLRRIVGRDFFLDWGGELQIATEGALTAGRVATPHLHKVDAKKRPIASMVDDAFQVWRTALHLALKHGRTLSVGRHAQLFASEFSRWDAWATRHSRLLPRADELLHAARRHAANPPGLYDWLLDLAERTGSSELRCVAYLVAKPLLALAADIETPSSLVEVPAGEISALAIRDISVLADCVAEAIIERGFPLGRFERFADAVRAAGTHSGFRSVEPIRLVQRAAGQGLRLDSLPPRTFSELLGLVDQQDGEVTDWLLRRLDNEFVGTLGDRPVAWRDLRLEANGEGAPDVSDPIVRLATLASLGAYEHQPRLGAPATGCDRGELERFLSYVVGHQRLGPEGLEIQIDVLGNALQRPLRPDCDCVVLFSGGVDSTAAALLAREVFRTPVLLWVAHGQRNEARERATTEALAAHLGLPLRTLRLDLGSQIERGWPRWEHIVPGRNLIFVALAGTLLQTSTDRPGTVLLAAHEEEILEQNTDKSERFFRTASRLLSEHHTRPLRVTTPFARATKAEVLSWWRRQRAPSWPTPYQTVTCYAGTECGRCKACLKRTLALVCAGWSGDAGIEPTVFSGDVPWLREQVGRLWEFPQKRRAEFVLAAQRRRSLLPDDLRSWLDELPEGLRAAAARREKEIEAVDVRSLPWI